jgi:nucleotide-binding universal stress UspA family protein
MVALDDSPAGREALHWGVREAALHTAELHVVHVVWPPEWPGHSGTEIADAARRMVEYNVEESGASGRVTTTVVTPEQSTGMDPGRVLVEESSGMDLVVCGALGFSAGQFFGEIVGETTSHQQDLSGQQIGSTAHHVLLHGPSHVAVVHAPRENLLEMRMRFDRERDWMASRTPTPPTP